MISFKHYISEKFSASPRDIGHKAGFWLSPRGDLVGTTSVHVKDIIQNPSKFGVTPNWIQGIYDKYDEPLGSEGDAREEIIQYVLTRGWIRIRRYTRPDYWSVTVNTLDNKTKGIIESWVNAFHDQGIMGRGTDIRVLQIKGDRLKTFEVADILKYGLDESKTPRESQPPPLYESSFEDQPDLSIQESSLSRIWQKIQDHTCGAISGHRSERTRAENRAANQMIKRYLLGKNYSVTAIQGNYIEDMSTKKFMVKKSEEDRVRYLSFKEANKPPVWIDNVNHATTFDDKDEASKMSEKYGGEAAQHVKEVVEDSFFVCNHKVDGDDGGDLERDLFRMGNKTDQDSILIVPVGGKAAYLLGTSKRENSFPGYKKTHSSGSGKYGRASGQFLSRIRGRAFAFEEIERPGTRNGKWGLALYAKEIDDSFDE